MPAFEKIFKDFGTDLPGMTMMLITISYFVVNYWYLAARHSHWPSG